jgi:hypothetical protein
VKSPGFFKPYLFSLKGECVSPGQDGFGGCAGPSKMPSQITMPKPKEKERIMLLSLLGTPGKKKKKRAKTSHNSA